MYLLLLDFLCELHYTYDIADKNREINFSEAFFFYFTLTVWLDSDSYVCSYLWNLLDYKVS